MALDQDDIDIEQRVMDVQLIDCDGRRCGRVDDVERDADGAVTFLLCGPGCWARRLPRPLGGLLRRVMDLSTADPDAGIVKVPWSAVVELTPYVHLDARADELGLGRGDDELRWLLRRLPWKDAQ